MKMSIFLIFLSLSLVLKAQSDSINFQGTIMDVEQMPSYYGGDLKLMKDVNTLAIFSNGAKTKEIEGRVYVSFFVDSDGMLSEIKLAKGIHPELDSIAVSVVHQIHQKWLPGRQRGKPVRVKYMLPINFYVNNVLAANDTPSGYWKFWGKMKFKRKYPMNNDDFNCWYNFIVNNYNGRKIKDLNLDLMFQKFNCNNTP